MALEAVAYGTGLNVANPPNTDQRKQGDDHLRLIKTAVLQSLQLMGGGMTTGGSATALTVTTGHLNSPTYQDGHLYTFALHTNIGASATVNYDTIGARTLKKRAAGAWADVAAADYLSGDVLQCYYEAGDSTMRIIGAAGRVGDLVAAYLPLTGGTLTGDLTIAKSNPSAVLNTGNANENALYVMRRNSVDRWWVGKINDAESGGGAGSSFVLARFSDAGAFVDHSISVARATGLVSVSNSMLVGGSVTIGDANFYLTVITDSFLNWDANDYFQYVRSSNQLKLFVGGVNIAYIDTNFGVRARNTPAALARIAWPGGLPTASKSMNVSSFTDNGTGDVTVNLTTALADADPVMLSGNAQTGGNVYVTCRNYDRTQTTTALQVAVMAGSSLTDAGVAECAWVQGDVA